jgi:serine/threonine-protein kinase
MDPMDAAPINAAATPTTRRTQRFVRSTAVLFAATTLACGGDGGPVDPTVLDPAPVIVSVIDIENFGDARDVEVTLRETGNAADVVEYRVFVARASAVDGGMPLAGTFERVQPASGHIVVRLSAAVTDEAGDALRQNVQYVAYVQAWTGAEAESPVSVVSSTFTLATTDIVESVAPLSAGTGGVAVDADGNVYVADFGTQLSGGTAGSTVYRVTTEGDVSVFATGLSGASGNAFDSRGNLFQSSIGGNTISRIAPDGTVTEFASGPAIVGPVGIAVAPGDTLFVANCNDNTIARVTPEGAASIFSSSALFACPNGIALASDGNLYVANFGNGTVIRVAPDGTASVFVTLPTNNLGHATFGNGVLYIAARGAHRIYEVTLDGTSRVLAGTGVRGRKDGAALHATLSFTNDIALTPDGTVLYFNDVDPSTPGTNTISPSWLRRLRLEEARTP